VYWKAVRGDVFGVMVRDLVWLWNEEGGGSKKVDENS